MPRDYGALFRKRADELRDAIDTATRPKHLAIHAQRTVIQASRLVVSAIEDGQAWLGRGWPTSLFKLSGSGTGQKHDGQLLGFWKLCVAPWVRRKLPTGFKAGAGGFDWSCVKRDTKGRALGRDGKPLGYIEYSDSAGRVGWKVDGEFAEVTDDYDADDWLAHLRARTRDWADTCDSLAELAAGAASEPAKKQRGRPNKNREQVRADRTVYEAWQKYRVDNPLPRPTFERFAEHRGKGEDQQELHAACERYRKCQARLHPKLQGI